MATHTSILAWEIPWTEEPEGLQSMGLQKSRNLAAEHSKLIPGFGARLPFSLGLGVFQAQSS